MKRTLCLAVSLCLATSVAFAQGAITDGDVMFEYTSFDVLGGTFADFEVDTGTDHMFGRGWFYRVTGDSEETVMPVPDAETYAGNVATLEWTDVNGRGFSATEVSTVVDTGEMAGGVRHDLTVTNNNPTPLTLTLFSYSDFDMDGTVLEDSANDLTPTNIGVSEISIGNMRGLGADAFKVTAWPEVRDELADLFVTDLDDSGTPFGPGDFTGALQWNEMIIPAGASTTYTVMHRINDLSAPLELAFSGDCPGDVRIRIAGATPGGSVAIAGGTLGSFTIPVGGCAGTDINLGSPSLIASVTADAAGEFNQNLNLAGPACGQIVQAIDLTTCGTTNTDPVN